VEDPQRAADLLRENEERWRVSLFGDRLHVITDADVETGKRDTEQKLAAAGIRVIEAREQPYSLEDVFIAVVEKARKQGKVAREE
jgi:ABC-2 type transport system ATP-binding protein